MERKSQVIEINLADVLRVSLKEWKKWLLFGVIAAIVLGGFYFIRGYSRMKTDNVKKRAALEAYEKDLEAYEQRKGQLNVEIEQISSSIAGLEEYLASSVLMNMDPSSKMQAAAEILIAVDPDSPLASKASATYDPSDSLIALYANSLSYHTNWDIIAQKCDIERTYASELLSVSKDLGANLISIAVSYPDEAKAKEIITEVLDQMDDRYEEMKNTFGEHSITIINEKTGPVNDPDLTQRQQQIVSQRSSYNNSIKNNKNELANLVAPVKPAGLTGRKALLKRTLIFVIIGGLFGLALFFVWKSLRMATDGRIHSVTELEEANMIPLLGSIRLSDSKGTKGRLSEWVEGGSPYSKEVALALIAEKIKTGAEGKKIALTGTVSPEEAKSISDLLAPEIEGCELVCALDPVHDSGAYRLLNDSDNAVVLEKTGVSGYRVLRAETRLIEAANKKLIGCILIG